MTFGLLVFLKEPPLEKVAALWHKFYRIPIAYAGLTGAEIKESLALTVRRQSVRGPFVTACESLFSRWLGADLSAVGTNCGESALFAALSTLPPKSSIVMPSFGCGNIYYAVKNAGHLPVFADVNEDCNVTADALLEKVNPQTAAVVVPSLYGLPAELEKIEKALPDRVVLLDDAAQCMGAKRAGRLVGTFGDAGVLSFGAKTITASAGGLLISEQMRFLDAARGLPLENPLAVFSRYSEMLARYQYRRQTLPFLTVKHQLKSALGLKAKRVYSRLSNLDAYLAQSQFHRIQTINQKRIQNARMLSDLLAKTVSTPSPEKNHVYSKYVLRLPFPSNPVRATSRPVLMTRFVRGMAALGIECEWCYVPLHYRFDDPSRLPITESLWQNRIAIPNHAGLGERQIHEVAEGVKRTLKRIGAEQKP